MIRIEFGQQIGHDGALENAQTVIVPQMLCVADPRRVDKDILRRSKRVFVSSQLVARGIDPLRQPFLIIRSDVDDAESGPKLARHAGGFAPLFVYAYLNALCIEALG